MTAGAKLKKIVGGVHNSNFPEKQTMFEPNLPKKRTFLEFYQQYNVDEHVVLQNLHFSTPITIALK